MPLLNRRGGRAEERVHLHLFPFELGLADVAARESAERGGNRGGGENTFHCRSLPVCLVGRLIPKPPLSWRGRYR